METTKPRVATRNSILKQPIITTANNGKASDGRPPILEKPSILKPKPLMEPNEQMKKEGIISNPVGHSMNDSPKQINAQSNVTVTEAKTVKSIKPLSVVNKLKISSSDLSKLRYNKGSINLNNVDGQGKQLIYDVREDEEQIVKMNEICELLIAGGYFRARIKGLHNFDKVIGGMCWAIQMCNVDLDVDIFYQESLSIGRKISLTEKIVSCLQRMKCPFKLEPHQIQGMDCIHIYPVIQWLVKKSLETREQNANYLRAYASWQFDRIYNTCVDTINKSVIFIDEEMSEQFIHPIKAQLSRRYVHPARNQLTSEENRVRTTLLEYGVIDSGSSQRLITSDVAGESNQKNESHLKIANNDDGKTSLSDNLKPRSDSDSQAFVNLLSTMTETSDSIHFIKVKSSLIGSVVSGQSEEIKRLAEDYEKNKEALSEIDLKFIKREAKLKEAIVSRQKELDQLQVDNPSEKLKRIKEKLEMLNEKLAEVEEMERNESHETKEEKLRLSELLSSLRKQKSEFKQFCREEKQRLEAQIEKLDQENAQSVEYNDRLREIDQELAVNEEKYDNVRKELAEVNKRYTVIQRKFDDIPGRTELAQYQKRFLELYNQLSNKHNETKKFYTLYNTLADERTYLEKEFNLINSILENFQKAYESSSSVKEDFLKQFNQIVDLIMQNNDNLKLKLQQEKAKRDELDAEYKDLLDYQRHYYMAVKKFKEICKDNEQLMAQLESYA